VVGFKYLCNDASVTVMVHVGGAYSAREDLGTATAPCLLHVFSCGSSRSKVVSTTGDVQRTGGKTR